MQNPSMLRTRWAALGAAVAVSLGAGGFGLARATSPDGAAAFVAITPCRILDTRPAFQVGSRSTPLGANDTHEVAGTGTTGDCTIPESATGLVLNVTAIEATAPTFITVFPSGADRPDASSLNPTPGAPPTPNAVTTNLGSGGRFSLYNLQGSVDLIADAVGYYTEHDHDDRYYTETEVDSALAAKADSDSVLTRAEVDAAIAMAVAPTSPVIVGVADFTFAEDSWSLGSAWSHAAGSGGCVFAPIDVPAGATISSVDVAYEAAAPVTDLAVFVGNVPNAALTYVGPVASVTSFSATDVAMPATLGGQVGSHTLLPDAPPTVPIGSIRGDDFSTVLIVCSTHSNLLLYGAHIHFAAP